MRLVKVEVVCALPRRAWQVTLELPAGATVADALAMYAEAKGAASEQLVAAYAIFGRRVEPSTGLRDGDRLELLRPLQADPKEARRRRARQGRGSPSP